MKIPNEVVVLVLVCFGTIALSALSFHLFLLIFSHQTTTQNENTVAASQLEELTNRVRVLENQNQQLTEVLNEKYRSEVRKNIGFENENTICYLVDRIEANGSEGVLTALLLCGAIAGVVLSFFKGIAWVIAANRGVPVKMDED